MSERIVSDPSQHGWVEVDGKWMWGGSGGGSGYDDAELRGLISDNAAAIAANASAISGLDGRVDALENAGSGSLWTDNGDGTITANFIAKASNFQTI